MLDKTIDDNYFYKVKNRRKKQIKSQRQYESGWRAAGEKTCNSKKSLDFWRLRKFLEQVTEKNSGKWYIVKQDIQWIRESFKMKFLFVLLHIGLFSDDLFGLFADPISKIDVISFGIYE